MAKKSKEKVKNKGPKGKKGRAKAKLERQWGEEAKDVVSVRSGKSRILSAKHAKEKSLEKSKKQSTQSQEASSSFSSTTKAWKESSEPTRIDTYSSDDNDDDNGGDSDNDGAGAFTSLLASIQKNQVNVDDNDNNDNDRMDDGSIDSQADAPEEDEMMDDAADIDIIPDSRDVFTERFSQSPLPEDEQKLEEVMTALQKTTKVMASHVDPSFEVQVSNSLQETLRLPGEVATTAATTSAASKHYWNKLALSSFAGSREILQKQWNKKMTTATKKKIFTPLQSVLYPLVSSYADVLLTTESRTNHKRQASQNAILMHILNHVLTSRGRIQKHNKRIKAVEAAEQKEQDEDEQEEDQDVDVPEHDPEVWRDQGFTRPTVLILLPTRGTCFALVQALLSLLSDHTNVENMDRFETEYGPPPVDADAEEGGETTDPHQAEQRRRQVLEQKGPEWLELFGDDTNDDDDFKMGLALIPKGNKKGPKSNNTEGSCSVKLYNDFYRSDIILASPLGLKMATSASEENQGDADFLSSIEVCWVARADALFMQNWDHVTDVMSILNQQPRNTNDTDFSRVRPYHLAGQAAHWRQVLVTSTLPDPLILSTFKRFAKSAQGLVKIRRRVPAEDASIANVIHATRQVFQRVPATSIRTQSQDRLDYFTTKVLPPILRNQQKHTLIFIPSYFDFVALRSYLLKQAEPIDFVSVTEYARTSEVGRGRARFQQGRKPLMLYTGRAHYFHRHNIKGVRHLVFFGMPEDALFYSDHVNLLNEVDTNTSSSSSSSTGVVDNNGTSCLALFTKYDAHALERIVGSSNSRRMVQSEKETFLFTS